MNLVSKISLWFKKRLLRKKLCNMADVEINRAKGDGYPPMLASFAETFPY